MVIGVQHISCNYAVKLVSLAPNDFVNSLKIGYYKFIVLADLFDVEKMPWAVLHVISLPTLHADFRLKY
jgi:hypothetical protein